MSYENNKNYDKLQMPTNWKIRKKFMSGHTHTKRVANFSHEDRKAKHTTD